MGERIARLTFLDYNLNCFLMAFKSEDIWKCLIITIHKCATIIYLFVYLNIFVLLTFITVILLLLLHIIIIIINVFVCLLV